MPPRFFRGPRQCGLSRPLPPKFHFSGYETAGGLGLRPTEANTRAMFYEVRTEDGRPGGFLHAT